MAESSAVVVGSHVLVLSRDDDQITFQYSLPHLQVVAIIAIT